MSIFQKRCHHMSALFSRFCWELSEVLHEHLGPLNEPSASSARIPVSPRLPPVAADPIIARDGPVADPVARKRDAAERVAAFRWRPAPPKVRKLKLMFPDGDHAAGIF